MLREYLDDREWRGMFLTKPSSEYQTGRFNFEFPRDMSLTRSWVYPPKKKRQTKLKTKHNFETISRIIC